MVFSGPMLDRANRKGNHSVTNEPMLTPRPGNRVDALMRLLAHREFEVYVWRIHRRLTREDYAVVTKWESWQKTGQIPLTEEDQDHYAEAMVRNQRGRLWGISTPHGCLFSDE